MSIWAAVLLLGVGADPPTLPTPAPTREIVAGLIEALKDADFEVRYYVATALSSVGTEAVEPLIRALEDKSPATRAAAAYALGQMGFPAAPATGPLLRVLKDDDIDVRRNTALALGRILASVRANTIGAEAYPQITPNAPPPVFPAVRPRS